MQEITIINVSMQFLIGVVGTMWATAIGFTAWVYRTLRAEFKEEMKTMRSNHLSHLKKRLRRLEQEAGVVLNIADQLEDDED